MANTERYVYLHEVRHGFVTVSPWGPGAHSFVARKHIPMTPDVAVVMVEGESRKCLLTLPEEFATLYGLVNKAETRDTQRTRWAVHRQFSESGQLLSVEILPENTPSTSLLNADPSRRMVSLFESRDEAERFRSQLADAYRRQEEDRNRKAAIENAHVQTATAPAKPAESKGILSTIATPSTEDQLASAVEDLFKREAHTFR